MIVYILGSIVIWIACGILAYGITFADFQRYSSLLKEMSHFSEPPMDILQVWLKQDKRIATMMACAGSIGLIVAFFGSNFVKHGLKFK